MSTKTDYTEEEWAALRRAPLVAGLAVSLADPGSPVGSVKEALATSKAISEAPAEGGNELIGAVAADVRAQAQDRKNPMGDLKLDPKDAKQQAREAVASVNDILAAKSTPEEADGYKRWLLDAARRTADAAKEGGFLGVGGERVSEREKATLDELAGALGVSAGPAA